MGYFKRQALDNAAMHTSDDDYLDRRDGLTRPAHTRRYRSNYSQQTWLSREEYQRKVQAYFAAEKEMKERYRSVQE